MKDQSECWFCLINPQLPELYLGYILLYVTLGLFISLIPQIDRHEFKFSNMSLMLTISAFILVLILIARDILVDWRYVPLSIIEVGIGFAIGSSLRGYLRMMR